MRRALLVAIVVTCSASVASSAQAPSAKSSDEQPRLVQVGLQLARLGKQLSQHEQDIHDMARPLTRDCEQFSILMDVYADADAAAQKVAAVSDLLDMYLSISTRNDRIAAAKVLTKHTGEAKDYLQSQIRLLNLSLSAPSLSPGAAVTATRIRDDIRSTIELFDTVKPQ